MQKKKVLFIVIFFCISYNHIFAQPRTDTLLQNILLNTKDNLRWHVLQHPQTYRYQIIYTQINRNKHNHPTFKNYYYNVDSLLYFNPASTVKLPLALLSLEKLNEMHIAGVNKFTPVQYDSSYYAQTTEYKDSTSQNGFPSIAHFIKKAFLISDNDAYNRMYEFTGQQTINRKLHEKGYVDVRITREFAPFTQEENRHTNAVRFITESGKLLYEQQPGCNTDTFDFSHVVKMGKAHYNSDDSLINEPFDFTTHNNISLEDLQQILQSVLFPSSVPANQRFNLTNDDYKFLRKYLSQYPSETNYPKYDSSAYYDSYVKFFFRNGSHTIPSNIRVFNKVGWSYGFLTDVSYVVDFKNKIEFMLSANIYVNSNGILNDDKYDYDSIGYPFLYSIGQAIYQYELKRSRLYKPNLKKFKIKYGRRKAEDERPLIKTAEN